MTDPDVTGLQILETDISPQHGLTTEIVGRLGRRKPFARVRPNADIIEATGGHYVMTHPVIFAPSVIGGLIFMFFAFKNNVQYSLTSWQILGTFVCVAIFVIQYIYVISNYAILTSSYLILRYITLSGPREQDYRLAQISNWGLGRSWIQVLLIFSGIGNLKPDVLGEATHKTLRSIRFASDVKEVGSELASRRRKSHEREAEYGIMEERASNILLLHIIMLLSGIAGKPFPREAIIEQLCASGWRRQDAQRMFDRLKMSDGEEPPELFARPVD
jgi:hypothetical protein